MVAKVCSSLAHPQKVTLPNMSFREGPTYACAATVGEVCSPLLSCPPTEGDSLPNMSLGERPTCVRAITVAGVRRTSDGTYTTKSIYTDILNLAIQSQKTSKQDFGVVFHSGEFSVKNANVNTLF